MAAKVKLGHYPRAHFLDTPLRRSYNTAGFNPKSGREAVGLSEVRLAEGETFDSLLRRFNKRVQQDGILSEIRRRQHFEPPSIKRKKKEATKRRKSRRNSR